MILAARRLHLRTRYRESFRGAYNGYIMGIERAYDHYNEMDWRMEIKYRDKLQYPMGKKGVIMDYSRGIPVSNGHIMGI